MNGNHGHESAGAQVVNGAGHQLLASAAFPMDQDGGIHGSNGAYELYNPLHRVALPHQFNRLNLLQAFPQPHIFLFDFAVFRALRTK